MTRKKKAIDNKPIKFKIEAEYFIQIEPDGSYRQEWGLKNVTDGKTSDLASMGIITGITDNYIKGYNDVMLNGTEEQKKAIQIDMPIFDHMNKLKGLMRNRFHAYIALSLRDVNEEIRNKKVLLYDKNGGSLRKV